MLFALIVNVSVIQNTTRDFVAGIRCKNSDINVLITDIKEFFKCTAIKLGLTCVPQPLAVTVLGALAGAVTAFTGIAIISLIGTTGYVATLGAGAVGTAVVTKTSARTGNLGEVKQLPVSVSKVDENTKKVQQMARKSGNNVAAFGALFQNKPKKSVSELTEILSDQSALEIDINMALERIPHCFHNPSDGLNLKGISDILGCSLKNTFALELEEDAETLAGSLVTSFLKGEEPKDVANRIFRTAILRGNSHPLKHQIISESFGLIELISQMCLQFYESLPGGNPSLLYNYLIPINYDKRL